MMNSRDKIADIVIDKLDADLKPGADVWGAADAILAAFPQLQGWQPIETAPKDGQPVLVCWIDGFWHPIVAHKEGKHWGVLGGEMQFTVLQVTPTHWMPLDPPPVFAAMGVTE